MPGPDRRAPAEREAPVREAPARRSDPGRRDRIIQACLDVIAEEGVAGTSHRKVAAAAGVPLGSMTYHFSGMEDLLHQAFDRFSQAVSERFEQRMAGAGDFEAAKRAVVDLATHDVAGDQRELILTHELYTLAAREPAFRDITNTWMARSRRALEQHFDPGTARLLDAMIEGLAIHRSLDTEPHDPAAVATAVERIAVANG
jgi:DNA-binding transcriptional regulator YbjK